MEIIVILLSILVYLLPSILGSDRKDAGGIAMINVFLGWTIIGYFIALRRAVGKDSDADEQSNQA